MACSTTRFDTLDFDLLNDLPAIQRVPLQNPESGHRNFLTIHQEAHCP